MSKKVLILSGSPRKGGNSDILCDEFLRGAQDAGHKAEKIRISEKKVAPCSGCYYCSTHGGACVHKDDMADILQKMIDADVIVLASPVYFYSISAQLKAVIDRTVARWLEVKDKEFYYITTMADEEKASADTTLACFRCPVAARLAFSRSSFNWPRLCAQYSASLTRSFEPLSRSIWYSPAPSHNSMTSTRKCRMVWAVLECFMPSSQSRGFCI